MNRENCSVCKSIEDIRNKRHPFFIAELESGFVMLGDRQYFRGYTLFLCKEHITELHLLPQKFRQLFLDELTAVSEAVYKCFKPLKLNYELLGNICPHIHWHIFPRYEDDPGKSDPVWFKNSEISPSDEFIPGENEILILKKNILAQIKKNIHLKIISETEF